ncbi:DUF262 domain-containing protein [Rothia mucilaginosa]|uniref:DUF262 domain-containing protein n=1 Tax=Rothia mucilaginosa TaxID=43675 RepID=UPI0034D6C81D
MSGKGIDSNIRNVLEFLDDGYAYGIPDFQRSYAWGDDNLDDFFKDINNIDIDDENSYHFIGSIISYDDEYRGIGDRDAKVKRRSIVDGQQRITTTLILLCALRDFAFNESVKESQEDGDEGVEDLEILFDDVDQFLYPSSKFKRKHRYPKLGHNSDKAKDTVTLEQLLRGPKNNTAWNEFYKDLVSLKSSNKKVPGFTLKNAYKKFTSYIENIVSDLSTPTQKADALISLRNKIYLLTYVDIKLNDIYSAYNIFMTLNDRGVPLTNADLIKSHVLRKMHDKSLDSLSIVWKETMSILSGIYSKHAEKSPDDWVSSNKGEIDEDRFFIAYARVFGFAGVGDSKKTLNQKNVFRYYEKALSNEVSVDKFINSIEKEAKIYRLVYDPNFYVDSDISSNDKSKKNQMGKIVDPLSALNLMGIKQHATFAYLLLRLCINSHNGNGEKPLLGIKVAVDVFNMLEKFHFLYNGIFKLPTNAIVRIYDKAVDRITMKTMEDDGGDIDLINKKKNEIRGILKDMETDFKNLLEKRGVDEDNFIEKFKSLKYVEGKRSAALNGQDYFAMRNFEPASGDNRIVKYVLSKYQPNLRGKPGDFVNIEHIYPRSLEGEVADNIGNLMLLHESVNRKLGNSAVKDKVSTLMKFYNNDTPEIFEISDTWEPKLFEGRAEKMAKRGFNVIWKI